MIKKNTQKAEEKRQDYEIQGLKEIMKKFFNTAYSYLK